MRSHNKHIAISTARTFHRGFLLLAIAMLFFTDLTLKAQVITNTGAAISITDVAVVDGDTVNNLSGEVLNDGTINLRGGYTNHGLTNGNGFYNIGGNWHNTSIFTPGSSTVQFRGSKNQIIHSTGDIDFYNLIINNSGLYPTNRISLSNNFNVTNSLTMSQGNVWTGGHILYLTNILSASLSYTSITGSRVIGRFQRGLSESADYLFPIGSATNYNPLHLNLNDTPVAGSIISQFLPHDPGDTGLPIEDDSVEIYEQYSEGYWSLTSVGFSSADFNLSLDATGFSDLQDISRIIKRPAGGDWDVDGTHSDMNGTVAFRENLIGNISPGGTEFAIGRPRPRIMIQPQDTSVCEGTDAWFNVKARGRRLTYQWQLNDGTGWVDLDDLDDEDVYSDVLTKELLISPTDISMSGNQYRVVITDKNQNVKISDPATLTVNPLPIATASPARDTICDGEMTDIALSSTVPGSTFELIVLRSGNISGATTILDGESAIRHTLINNSLSVDSVIYRVIPTGPYWTYCTGYADTVVIYVNPTPKFEVSIQDTIYCDSSQITINVEDLLGDIIGVKVYDLTTNYTAGEVIGVEANATNVAMETSVSDQLFNLTRKVQEIEYTFRYRINRNGAGNIPFCDHGIESTITIYLNPTPVFSVSVPSDTICNETNVTFTLTDSLLDVQGDKVYDLVTTYNSGLVEGVELNQTNIPMVNPVNNILINKTNVVQEVSYHFQYRLNDDRDGTPFCDHGIDTTIVVSVNPTPNITVVISNDLISSDTVFCNGSKVDFYWRNEQGTTGDVKYHLYISGDDGIIVGETLAPDLDSLDTDFSNTLSHLDAQTRYLNYNFEPYIENATGTLSCYAGIDTTLKVQIVPVFKSDYSVNTLLGGYNVSCFGDSDGFINLDPVGGYYEDDYDFIWKDTFGLELQTSEGQTDVLNDLSAGWYYYELEDAIGCLHDSLFEIKEPDKVIMADTILQSPLCYGDGFTGNILIDVDGGVEPYSYKWVNLQTAEIKTDEDLYGVGLDQWKIFYKDIHNCGTSEVYRLVPTDPFNSVVQDSSEYGVYDISCNGASDARVLINGVGGAEPYHFKWYYDDLTEMGITSSVIEDLSPGTYYYQVIDDNGCKLGAIPEDTIVQVIITEPDPISFARDPSDLYAGAWDNSCHGLSDGKINLQYKGGHTQNPTMDNDFVWTQSGGGSGIIDFTDSTQSGLSIGIYNVQVTDQIGCFNDTTIQLYEPVEITYRDSSIVWEGDSSIRCFGEANGEIYLYDIYGGGTKSDTGDIPSEFSYQWTTMNGHVLEDNSLKDQKNLTAGWYKYRIMDNNNPLCFKDDSIRLSEPDILRADTLVDRDNDKNGYAIRCYGFDDGSIDLSPEGGTSPYRYRWTDSEGEMMGESGSGIENLFVGAYSATVIDTNGCEVFYEFELNSPDTIVMHPNEDFIECYGDTSSIYLSPSGGYLNPGNSFRYTWEGLIGTSKYNDYAGTYFVEVSDDNNCLVTDSLTLEQSTEIIPVIDIISLYNGRNISCEGYSDGALEVNISGGNPIYTYQWNRSGESTILSDINQLQMIPAGVYVVSGEDQYGCVYRDSLEIEEPRAISIEDYVIPPNCDGARDGKIDLYVSYGTPEYAYTWTGPQSPLTGSQLEGLVEGSYSVIVKDLNECIAEQSFELVAPEALVMNVFTEPAECRDENDGSIDFETPEGGTWPYTILVNDLEVNTATYENLKPGTYLIHLIDGNGCNYRDTVEVDVLSESCLNPPNAFTPNGDGANDYWIIDLDEDNSNDMYLYPDAELRIYNRWGELVYQTTSVVDEPWDGKYYGRDQRGEQGRDLPVDSYHYILNLGPGEETLTGTVTIIR